MMKLEVHRVICIHCQQDQVLGSVKMGGAASSESQNQVIAIGNNEEPARETKEKSRKSEAETSLKHGEKPHNYDAIIREAEIVVGIPHDLYSGILLENKSKKYWVELESGCNCFTIYARGLSITWSEDARYWQWIQKKEASEEVSIEVASLLNVCWLEVHGTIKEAYLTPNTAYEIVFVVMLKDPAYGWEVPVNLRLVSPGNRPQEHKEFLLEKPRGRWIELTVGHFVVTNPDAASADEVEFSMIEYEGGLWKRGLIVKGAIIRPKK